MGFCVGGTGGPDPGRQCAAQPLLKDIRTANLTATCPREAGIIVGLPESLISNVSLTGVRLSAQTGLTVRNAKAVQLKDVKIEAQKGPPIVLDRAQVEG